MSRRSGGRLFKWSTCPTSNGDEWPPCRLWSEDKVCRQRAIHHRPEILSDAAVVNQNVEPAVMIPSFVYRPSRSSFSLTKVNTRPTPSGVSRKKIYWFQPPLRLICMMICMRFAFPVLACLFANENAGVWRGFGAPSRRRMLWEAPNKFLGSLASVPHPFTSLPPCAC